ncbi:hypothetical protein [Fuerstiella marisgermanici]|uniref:Uncharacterized protein n=1 Tax=Fuerstiella marisgermanici TaxID=1891926 RepID=A0A1P8WJL0_9PLAN|nr:hypothetical protein [Fuerstiella marisgermanici]APZ94227.1 hypothetical protein Fuma_03851 [Fuerstiella marisgermanici]
MVHPRPAWCSVRSGQGLLASRGVAAVVLAFVLCCSTSTAVAQLSGRLAEKPLGVGYVRDITQVTMFEYMQTLAKRLEIGKAMFQSMPMEQFEGFRSKVEVPINGAAWYMVQGLLPSYEVVYFQQVIDVADAKRMIDARKKMFGPNGSVETGGDGRYKLVRKNSWTMDVPEGQTAEEYVEQVNKQNASSRRSFQQSAKVVENDGKEQIEQSWSTIEFHRFHDNLLFTTSFEELWDMDLPTRESLTSSISSRNDMGVEAFFDRIPMAIKQLGWNMLNSTAGTQMQRRDGELQTTADLRKSSFELGLAVVKAVIFDVEQTNGWMRLATDEEQALRGEINFDARRNSGLTKQLAEISSGNARFAAIVNDDAAATVHVCVKFSEDSAGVPNAAAAWMLQAIADATNNDSTVFDAATRVAESLSSFSEHRTVEAFLKVGYSDETDGVFYGGLQVDNNPNLLNGIYTLIINSGEPTKDLEAFQLVEIDGRSVIQMTLPESDLTALQRHTGLSITHAYLMHENSCLWLAVGSENAIKMLQKSAARCMEAGLVARTPLLTAKVDVEKWLSWPEDEPTGIAGFLAWADANLGWFPPSPMTVNFGQGGASEKPAPLLQPCLDLGGETNAAFTVIADKAGVRASLHLGEAVANYYVARMIDAQDRMMRRFRAPEDVSNEEATEKETVGAPVEVVE